MDAPSASVRGSTPLGLSLVWSERPVGHDILAIAGMTFATFRIRKPIGAVLECFCGGRRRWRSCAGFAAAVIIKPLKWGLHASSRLRTLWHVYAMDAAAVLGETSCSLVVVHISAQ